MKNKSTGEKALPQQVFKLRPYKYDLAMRLAAKRAESHPQMISMASNLPEVKDARL